MVPVSFVLAVVPAVVTAAVTAAVTILPVLALVVFALSASVTAVVYLNLKPLFALPAAPLSTVALLSRSPNLVSPLQAYLPSPGGFVTFAAFALWHPFLEGRLHHLVVR